jgi:CUB/sushi domain-containing protein
LKEKMTSFKIPEEYGRHAMDDCNEAVPNLVAQFKEAMAKGGTRGEIYSKVENNCKSALKTAAKVITASEKQIAEGKTTKKDAKKKLKNAEPPDEIQHPLTGDSKVGTWEETKAMSKEQIQFFKMLDDNANKIADMAEELLDEASLMKDTITDANKVANHRDDVDDLISKAEETCVKNADTLWDNLMDMSKDFECGVPPPVEHSAEQCDEGNTRFKPKCHIACMEGYDGKGTKNKLRCVRQGKFGEQLYGEWFGMGTCAAKNCGRPPKINNAKQAKQEILFPNVAMYVCNEGFSVDGNAKHDKTFGMPCQSSGTFMLEPAKQKCEPVRCGTPHEIKNGQREEKEFIYTEIAHYVCDKGHTVDATAAGAGHFEVSCQATGEFTERQKCRPVLCGPAQIFEFTDIVSDSKGMQVYSNVVDYECESGYSLDGQYGGKTTYSLIGNELGDFVDKGGQPTLPVCLPVECGFVPPIKYGVVAQVMMLYPDYVWAIAEEGHSKTGEAGKGLLMKIKCGADGTFKDVETYQKVKCGTPPKVDHGKPADQNPKTFGDQIPYTCDDGYSIDMTNNEASKSFHLNCEADGDFSAVPGQGKCANIDDCAEHTCGPFGDCVDKLMDYNCKCMQGFEEVVEEDTGEKICGNVDDCGPSQCGVGQCEDLVDDYNCICPEGYFEEDQPEEKMCSPVVCGLPPVKNDAVTVPEAVQAVKIDFTSDPVTYQCLAGYTLDAQAGGPNHMTTECQADESFTDMPDSCQPVECGDAPEVDKAKMDAKSAVFGEIITYNCDEGHTVDGTSAGDAHFTISCLETGELSLALSCLPVVCGEPDQAQNAFRPSGSLHFKQKVMYECFEGFSLDGDSKGKKDYDLECKADGSFDSIENCNPVKCGEPLDKLNVRHSTIPDLGNIHYPQIVEILCDDGFTVNFSRR